MKTIRTFESYTNDANVIELVNDTIIVHDKELSEYLPIIGDGIYDIDYESKEVFATVDGKLVSYYSNTITIIFEEGPQGYISIEEWNKIKNAIERMNDNSLIDGVTIDASHNKVIIDLSQDHPMEVY